MSDVGLRVESEKDLLYEVLDMFIVIDNVETILRKDHSHKLNRVITAPQVLRKIVKMHTGAISAAEAT